MSDSDGSAPAWNWKVTLVATVFALLTGMLAWFGVNNWQEFKVKVLGEGATPSSGTNAPAATNPGAFFPPSFSAGDLQFTIEDRPSQWSTIGPICGEVTTAPKCAGEANATYTDPAGQPVRVYIGLYQDDATALVANRVLSSGIHFSSQTEYFGVSGRYLINCQTGFLDYDNSAPPYTIETAVASQLDLPSP